MVVKEGPAFLGQSQGRASRLDVFKQSVKCCPCGHFLQGSSGMVAPYFPFTPGQFCPRCGWVHQIPAAWLPDRHPKSSSLG